RQVSVSDGDRDQRRPERGEERERRPADKARDSRSRPRSPWSCHHSPLYVSDEQFLPNLVGYLRTIAADVGWPTHERGGFPTDVGRTIFVMNDRKALLQTFQERLSKVIRDSGMNRSEFAAATGVDRSTLSQLLSTTNRRLPRVETLVSIAEQQQASLDWL